MSSIKTICKRLENAQAMVKLYREFLSIEKDLTERKIYYRLMCKWEKRAVNLQVLYIKRKTAKRAV